MCRFWFVLLWILADRLVSVSRKYLEERSRKFRKTCRNSCMDDRDIWWSGKQSGDMIKSYDHFHWFDHKKQQQWLIQSVQTTSQRIYIALSVCLFLWILIYWDPAHISFVKIASMRASPAGKSARCANAAAEQAKCFCWKTKTLWLIESGRILWWNVSTMRIIVDGLDRLRTANLTCGSVK